MVFVGNEGWSSRHGGLPWREIYPLTTRCEGKVPGGDQLLVRCVFWLAQSVRCGLFFTLCTCLWAVRCNSCQCCELSPCAAWLLTLPHPGRCAGQVGNLLCLVFLGWPERPERIHWVLRASRPETLVDSAAWTMLRPLNFLNLPI